VATALLGLPIRPSFTGSIGGVRATGAG